MSESEFDTRPKMADLRGFCSFPPGPACDPAKCALIVTEALTNDTVSLRVKPEFWVCVKGESRQNEALGRAVFSAYITKGHDGQPVDKGGGGR